VNQLNKSKYLFYTFCLFFLTISTSSFAAAYWIDVKGSGKVNEKVKIELCYGSMDEFGIRHRDTGKELDLAGDFQIRIIDSRGSEQLLTLNKQKDCWLGIFIPSNEGRYRIIGINDKHPVVDRSATGGKNVLPIDYISAVWNVGQISQIVEKPVQMLDLILNKEDKKVTLKAFFQNKPSKEGTKIRIFNPENWEKEVILNKNGEAVFYTTMKGLYIIRQDYNEPKSGVYKGVNYSAIRHRCNYFLLEN
jgi:hypothetical protein